RCIERASGQHSNKLSPSAGPCEKPFKLHVFFAGRHGHEKQQQSTGNSLSFSLTHSGSTFFPSISIPIPIPIPICQEKAGD
ncbi:MAG: hypothetical protein ACLFUY_05275, partial [Desulfobacterales bacterium]